MHFSGDAKDLLYNCTNLTAMMRRRTRVLICHTFCKLRFKINKINHKKRFYMYVKREMYRMRRLILVFAIRTCYKCHFSWYMYSPIRPVWPNSLCRFLIIQKIVWVNGGDCPQNRKVFYLNIHYDQFVSVVALNAPFHRQNLIVRFVYIRPVYEGISKSFEPNMERARNLDLFCFIFQRSPLPTPHTCPI